MRNHIIELLDRGPVSGLSDAERASAEAHAAGCAGCARAYAAARAAGEMLAARAAETHEPSPFFQARVMAALRERAAAAEIDPIAAMWHAARALVYAMALVVAGLGGAAFLAGPADAPAPVAAAPAGDVSDWELLEAPDPADGGMTDDQLLAVMYDAEGDDDPGR